MTATSDRPALAPRTTRAGDAGPTSQGDARVDVAAHEKPLLGRWADQRAAARARPRRPRSGPAPRPTRPASARA
ncbi:hypothetical protein, partial [Cellulosimicrobium funkei]